MARYIEKEPLCAWLENMGVSDFIIRKIESEANFPTADVIPKSEFARLQEDVDRLQEINNRQVENIKLAEQRVASEIFEEMQSCLIQRHWNGLDIISFEFDAVKYAELKKKYTEGE